MRQKTQEFSSGLDRRKNEEDLLQNESEQITTTAGDEAGYSSSSSTEIDDEQHRTPRGHRSSPAASSDDLGYESPASESNIFDNDSEAESVNWEEDFLPEFLQVLNRGLKSKLGAPPTNEKPPEWLDLRKFKIGQEFALKYYAGVNYAEMSSLLILFAFHSGMQPIILTENSGTPVTAFKRYLSTALRVKSWFETDIWDKNSLGYKNIKAVNALHRAVSNRANSMTREEFNDKISEIVSSKRLCCPLGPTVKEDFRSAVCPFFSNGLQEGEDILYFNQCSMSATQFGFVGLVVTFPEKFGAANATEEELEGFIHLWQGVGYLLGIEDEYNFCNGSLDEVRSRSREVIRYWIVPQFTKISSDWEYYSRCMVKGISFYIKNLSFEVTLVYLCWVLGVNAPKVNASLTWGQYFRFTFTKFVFCIALRVPFLLSVFNRLVNRALDRAQNFPAEKMASLEKENLKICNC